MSKITLYHGDCLDILPTLPAGSVDAVVMDPPYGKRYHDGGLGEIPSSKWASPKRSRFKGTHIIGDREPDTRIIWLLPRLLCDGAAVYLFSQWRVEAEWLATLDGTTLTVRNRLIWVKPFQGAGDLKTTYGPRHESCFYVTKGRHELQGKRGSDVWLEPVGSNGCFRKGKLHPNEKPLELILWLLEKSSSIGDTILDPSMGSGITGVACVQTGRNFIGIEIDEGYFQIAQQRIATAQTTPMQLEFIQERVVKEQIEFMQMEFT